MKRAYRNIALSVFVLLVSTLGILSYEYSLKAPDIVLGGQTSAAPITSTTVPRPNVFTVEALGLLEETNTYRASKGLAPLVYSTALEQSATLKAQDMQTKDYWGHIGPDGTEPWVYFKQVGYSYSHAGENLAWGYASSTGVVQGWVNSPTHEANLLGDYTEMGAGILKNIKYQDKTDTSIIVVHYAKP